MRSVINNICRRWDDSAERGDTSIELILLTPVVILIIGVIIFGGIIARAQSVIGTAASAGARDAALTRTPATAESAARDAVTRNLQELKCSQLEVNVDNTSAVNAEPDTSIGKRTITVHVRCTVETNPMGLPSLPGARSYEATGTAAADVFRSEN